MNFVFRTDASAEIGIGHIIRCLTIAEELKKHDILSHFICRDLENGLVKFIQSKSIRITNLEKLSGKNNFDNVRLSKKLQELDALQTIEVIQSISPVWLVVDHYWLDKYWEIIVNKHVEKLMVLDDLAINQHHCHTFLNPNPVFSKEDYNGLLNKECEFLLGKKYILLADAYRNSRDPKFIRKGTIKRILVFFTAGDDEGETLKSLSGIKKYISNHHIDVVVGKLNPYKNEVKKVCDQHGWNYYCQIDYMHELINNADIVIGGAGSNSWERCALGAPALITVLAENQQPNADFLSEFGAAKCVGNINMTKPNDYYDALIALDEQELIEMSTSAFNLMDADGVLRVTKYMIDNTN